MLQAQQAYIRPLHNYDAQTHARTRTRLYDGKHEKSIKTKGAA